MPNFLIDSLTETLREIWVMGSTCLVRLSTESGLRMAFFENGALVYFASEDVREPLDAWLLQDERLGGADVRAALAASPSPQKPLVARILEETSPTPRSFDPGSWRTRRTASPGRSTTDLAM